MKRTEKIFIKIGNVKRNIFEKLEQMHPVGQQSWWTVIQNQKEVFENVSDSEADKI